MIAQKIIAMFDAGEFDVCTLFFSRFRSVIAQIPTAQQIIPPVIDAKAPTRRPAPSTNTSRRRTRSCTQLLPRNIAVQMFRALLENVASFYGAQMTRDGQCHPQRRRHDPQADADL